MKTITKFTLNLTKIITLIAFLGGLKAQAMSYYMQNHRGQRISLRLALTKEESMKGLSGLRAKQFSNQEGMLFVNKEMAPRKFWMPDTYFNLDIIFLDSHYKIIGIESNVPSHPGMQEPPEIYKTKIYDAQYILETKTESPFSKSLKNGDQLKFISGK